MKSIWIVFFCLFILSGSGCGSNNRIQEPIRLTNNLSRDILPDWSPDGTQIAFIRSEGDSKSAPQIFTINVENGTEIQIANNDVNYLIFDLGWTSNREELAFIMVGGDVGPEIGILKYDERLEEAPSILKMELLRGLGSQDFIYDFDWSPNENEIAIVRNYDGSTAYGLFTVFRNNTGLKQLTHGFGVLMPSWSADGNFIAFKHVGKTDQDAIVFEASENGDIYTIRVDGAELFQLTTHVADDSEPAWSPSGDWIAFVSERDGNKELYMIKPDGSDLTRLTTNEADDYSPTWSPDGAQIAFVSERDGNPQLYIMDVP